MWSHSLSGSLMSLGLTPCVWEAEQLVIIAWQMCEFHCLWAVRPVLPLGHQKDMTCLTAVVPSAGGSRRTNRKRARWGSG